MENQSEQRWRTDPRLHNMDAKKIALLASFADELAAAPKNQKLNVFLKLNQKFQSNGITFSSKEQELLFFILTENLSEEDRKKAAMIRTLAAQFRQKPP